MNNHLKRFRPRNDAERAVWKAIKGLEFFAFADVSDATGLPDQPLRVLLGKINRTGHTRIHHTKGNTVFFTTQSVQAMLEGKVEERMSDHGAVWTAIRITKEFVIADLFAGISPSRPDIEVAFIDDYCEALRQGDMLKLSRRADPESGRSAVYRLINDTGPLPPKPMLTKVLVDQNTRQIAYVEGFEQ
jgi:hypothetical protein